MIQELGYLNIYCNSEFHASCEAMIRQQEARVAVNVEITQLLDCNYKYIYLHIFTVHPIYIYIDLN